MGQHLQGIKRGIELNLCLRHLAFDGIGKAKEQGITTGENDHTLPTVVLLEDSIQGSCDVDPFRIVRK